MIAPSTDTVEIRIAISARHAHLTQSSLDRLFGPAYRLHVLHPLTQPGQYAAEESVTLIGPRGELSHVRIVGPPRESDQIELARTDEIALGLDAPLRCSGDLDQTPGVVVVGPAGRLTLPHGVILAQRHIHMSPADAICLGVQDHDLVEVSVDKHGRSLTFGDVRVRVAPDYQLELHLDTDEGNAAGLSPGELGLLLAPVQARVRGAGKPSPNSGNAESKEPSTASR